MKKADIERGVSSAIRKAVETSITAAIAELNHAGHNYQAVSQSLFEWAEPGSDSSLHITCAIAVDISARQADPPVDQVVESFITLGESGDDAEATILNQLEGDMANGGLIQLYANNGEDFIHDCIALLKKIKSRSALRIVETFRLALEEEQDTLGKYEAFQKRIDELNDRFWKIKENLPALFMRYRQK